MPNPSSTVSQESFDEAYTRLLRGDPPPPPADACPSLDEWCDPDEPTCADPGNDTPTPISRQRSWCKELRQFCISWWVLYEPQVQHFERIGCFPAETGVSLSDLRYPGPGECAVEGEVVCLHTATRGWQWYLHPTGRMQGISLPVVSLPTFMVAALGVAG